MPKLDPMTLLAMGDTDAVIAWHRSWAGDAVMTTPSGEQPPPPPAGSPPPPAPPQGEQTPPSGFLSQEEVTRIAAREKDQGERAGKRALLAALGFDPEKDRPEDVKALLDAHRQQADAALTEQQRKDKELSDREAALTAKEQQTQAREHRARLTEVLVAQGVQSANLDDARTLLSTVQNDASDEALVEAVNGLKTRLPALFVSSSPPPPPGGGFPGTPPRPQPNGDAMARGAERARQMGLAPKSA